MVDRETKVKLSLYYQQYLDGMAKIRKSTKDTATDAQKLAETRKHFDLIGKSALAAGALIGIGLGAAIAKAAQFDQAISGIQAATHASAAEMDKYRQAALKAGADTVFSATESADAITELAKAGLSTSAILGGGLSGALNLAAASGMGVADAAGVAATTLQQFQLKGSQASHVADLLAAGAGKAMGDVSDLSQALAQSGTVANQFGLSVDETVGTLSAFASAGLLGSDAGTSFRTMLLRLANPTGQASDEMKALGVNAYDATGKFVGMAGLAGQLKDGLSGLTQEQQNASLAIIFGQDAIRGANVLFKEGAKGIQDWTDKVNDQGYAAKTAAIQMDNLKGDVEQLKGSLETALISMGEAAQGPLRAFTQALTDLVNGFNDLPEGAKQAIALVTGLGGAALAASGAYLLLIPKIAEYRAALESLGLTASKTATTLGLIGKVGLPAIAGIAIGITALDALRKALDSVGPPAEQIANKVKTASDAVSLFQAGNKNNNLALASDQVANLGKALDGLGRGGLELTTTFTALDRLGAQLAELSKTDLPAAQRQFRLLAEAAGLTDEQQSKLLDKMSAFKKALTEQATASDQTASKANLLKIAQGEAEDSTVDNTAALKDLSGQAQDTGDDISDLADTIRGFGSATLNVRDAQRKFEQSFDDLTASIAENGKTLDVGTQKGRDNQGALDDLAKSTLEFAASTVEQTGNQEDANKVIADGRKRLIDMLGQFGITGSAADQYADKLGLIPASVNTALTLSGANQVISRIQSIFDRYNGRVITIRTAIGSNVNYDTSNDSLRRASGGAVVGPGSATSDSINARLSNGEHVLDAGDVSAMGGQAGVYRFRQQLHQGTLRYADGGSVGTSTSAAVKVPAAIQRVTEHIEVKLDKRVLAEAIRQYDRAQS